MIQSSSIDFSIRTTVFYAAEGTVGILLTIIFFYFSRVYNRHFIRMWACSWMAFTLSMVALVFLTLNNLMSVGVVRHALSFVSILLQLFQVFFLMLGSIEVIRYLRLTTKAYVIWTIVLMGLAACAVLPYMSDPNGGEARYLIRLSVRYGAVALGFTSAALLIVRSIRFSKGIGRVLIAISFLIYGLYHFYYIGVVVTNVMFHQGMFPFLFGIVELIIVSVTGLSMAVWLLEDERRSLYRTNRNLDELYYRLSHDLRAPIASLLGLNHLARLEVNDKNALSYLAMMDTSISKLDNLIRDLIGMSKNRLVEVKLEEVKFDLLMEEIRQRIFTDGKTGKVQLLYCKSAGNVLVTDVSLLRFILTGLIDNAVTFRSANDERQPFVKVSFERTLGRIKIAVEDNGIGMEKESVARVFEMFYKEDSNSTRSGLGLFSVFNMVEKLDGFISVKSTPGTGTIFTISLPAL